MTLMEIGMETVLSNRNEFLVGTHPNDPSSALCVQLERTSQGSISIHFPYLPNLSYFKRCSKGPLQLD